MGAPIRSTAGKARSTLPACAEQNRGRESKVRVRGVSTNAAACGSDDGSGRAAFRSAVSTKRRGRVRRRAGDFLMPDRVQHVVRWMRAHRLGRRPVGGRSRDRRTALAVRGRSGCGQGCGWRGGIPAGERRAATPQPRCQRHRGGKSRPVLAAGRRHRPRGDAGDGPPTVRAIRCEHRREKFATRRANVPRACANVRAGGRSASRAAFLDTRRERFL